MADYMHGIILQVDAEIESTPLTPERHMALRRQTVAAKPLYALGEYAYGINLPDYIFDHQSIKDLENIGEKLIILQNDMVSYKKEELAGEPNTIITIYC
ncbi:terpene synthase metal binding domain protein [Penicillium herquei]|nr:terpene synthase metal binding domain protein [Penicillium herquei]